MSQTTGQDIDQQETQEWLDALDSLVDADGVDRAEFILAKLQEKASSLGVKAAIAGSVNTPYINTIGLADQPDYPGDLALEEKIEGLVRWNAAVMVASANKRNGTLGGHIGTFASSCTLYQVGFNHFFHAATDEHGGDLVLFQGHASPGMYARSYLEGRFDNDQMHHFRQEVEGKGLSSYPHPWLMPDYWQVPTISMGLGPILAIYQARFMKYLDARGITKTSNRKVWTFCGDGEMDEPESLGAITRAGREQLDNLIFVINCNTQRLDGLVNGNGKIMQELEGVYRGAGWNVVKVVWGSNWEPLFQQDHDGVLQQALMDACDGDFQTYRARGGAYMREHFFGQHPALTAMVESLSDDEIFGLLRGGHDPIKVYAAYKAATEHRGQPTVILANTVKGYGMGHAGDARNIAHNQKKLKEDELKYFRDFFNMPVTDKQVEAYELVRPAKTQPEMQYLHERRQALGGYLPARTTTKADVTIPAYQDFAKRLLVGTGPDREMSTTTAFVQILSALAKDKSLGKYVVPITPDESRTFGMEGLFRQLGIYHPEGQKYEPEDRQQVMWYKESKDGQILQEGINEAGAMGSWIAAATAYSVHHVPMMPFYIYYSMFGFQRIGDLAWAAGDMRARGFLLGATAGRTTLNGEGLQHEDGHSHVMANLVPSCKSYDPTYAYELAVIVWRGLQEMMVEEKDVFYYITMMNENYSQPAMPEGCEAGILKGLYSLKTAEKPNHKAKAKAKQGLHVQLMGSGTILREVEAAAELLTNDFGVTADIWSMTSSNELYRDAMETRRYNRLNPTKKAKKAYVTSCLEGTVGPIVVATDYVKLYTEQLRGFMPRRFEVLGTDGFGRSDTREALRSHFEVDRYHVVIAALDALAADGMIDKKLVAQAIKQYGVDANKVDPLHA